MRTRIALTWWVALLLAACATPTPQIVKETVIATRPPLATHTPIPTYTLLPTHTLLPPLPTHTPHATHTPYPTYTATPAPTHTPEPTSTPTPLPPTSTPAHTPTPVPPTNTPRPKGEVLRLKAPRRVYDAWKGWEGRYVLYAHKEAGIREVRDLTRLELYEAIFNPDGVPFSDDQIVDSGDIVVDFCFALGDGEWGCDVFPVPHSTRDTYASELLGHWNRVGFMTPAVADYFQFNTNEKLVRIEFELEP